MNETCWKLHGKPQGINHASGFKGGQQRSQAYVVDAINSGEEQSKYNNMELGELNQEDIEKLKNFLGSLEKPRGVCPLTHSGKFPFSHAFSVSGMSLSSCWIIDSGAIDHMTHSSEKFSSYIPCPSNKKITIADGSLATVTSLNVNPSLSLKNVLHVPKLSTNLVSIHQLIKDMICSVIFYPTHCVFQDRVSGKMIGHAKEKNKLYYLDDTSSGNVGNGNQPPISFLSVSSSSNKDQIWLYHF